MKKWTKLSLILLAVAVMVTCLVLTACTENPPSTFKVEYFAGEGGSLSGHYLYLVKPGEDVKSSVTAIPDVGYVFVKWSDNGSADPTRSDTNVQANISATAEFAKATLNLQYNVETGGYVNGKTQQTVTYGEDANTVTAIANNGFVFIKWSDGVQSVKRQDNNVITNISATALFAVPTQQLEYEYNGATGNNTAKNISLAYDRLKQAEFAVPQKTGYVFHGWCLDEELTTKAVNAKGGLLIHDDILINTGKLYAKWIADDIIVYPVLMAFVTQTKADLPLVDGTIINVDYTMSDIERQILELYPTQIANYLNEIFNGRVHFEFDTFFTTEAIGESSFIGVGTPTEYYVMSYCVPEIGLMKGHNSYYRTTMTIANMSDYSHVLHTNSGRANAKYASMSMEGEFYGYRINNITLETAYTELLDTTNPQWEAIKTHYLHEFIHTSEQYFVGKIWEFHKTSSGLETIKLYLLNELVMDNRKVGIPFSYWEGDLEVSAHYYVQRIDGIALGDIISDSSYASWFDNIPFGADVPYEVTVIASDGYRFVRWSDGVTTPTRHDKNLVGYLRVYAIFEKI